MGAIVKPPFPRLQRGDRLAHGLVAAYQFYEGSGPTLHDISGNRNNIPLVNSPLWVPGRAGWALNFNGTSQYCSTGQTAVGSVNFAGPITCSAWIKPAALTSFYQYIFGRNGSVYSDGKFGIFLTASAPNEVTIRCGGNQQNITLISNIVAGFWQHLLWTADGAHWTVYLNGSQDGQIANTNVATSGTASLDIAFATADINYYFGGSIDDVRIYNRALSADEIRLMYALSGAP